MKINVLPESIASRIAAGEVVERPASVVKELVENALDAGAKEISVWVEKSGTSLIRVSDYGDGIAQEDLPLAVERHATSKLKEEVDLFRIATLGFRGEALPSIGSVARLEIVSRAREMDAGARLFVEGGKKSNLITAGSPYGTTVEVRDLFFNTPARRKFLRSPATELAHICDVINRLALAYGDVHFRLFHEGRTISDYVAVPELKDRLGQIFGVEIGKEMASFSRSQGGLRLAGFLSFAPASYSNSRYLMTYVNRRFVRDRTLTHAILQGYETLLMKGRYPAVVLYLEIPFEEVDVNVHPAKYEVRFRRPTEVHDGVAEGIREALRSAAKKEVSSLRARGGEDMNLQIREPSLPYAPSIPRADRPGLGSDDTIIPSADPRKREGFFTNLEILGQVLGCYIVCASERGLALIDQHAAHERVAFEKMRGDIERGKIEQQELLIPQTVELPQGEALLLERRLGLLSRLGFTVEPFGRNTFVVKAVPALLPVGDYRGMLRAVVAELVEMGHSEELRQSLEDRLMTLACHSVIRANRRLEREEILALLKGLDGIDFATQCPHGRPVLLEITPEEFERMFKRT